MNKASARPSGSGRQRVWALAFGLTLMVAMVVALLPPGQGADWFPQADKLRHAVAFAALWWMGRHLRWRSGWRLALLLLAFGVAVELAQGMTSYRDASAADVLADLAGMALGAWMWRRRS